MSSPLTRMSLSCLLLTPLLWACGNAGSRPTPLKDFPPFRMHVTTSSPNIPDYFSIVLIEENPGLFQGACPELLPEVRATFNGQPVPVESRGESSGGLLGQACRAPAFYLPRAVRPEAREDVISTIEITDGTRTLHMEVKGVGVPRTARLLEPANGVLSAGSDVVLTWTPTTDILRAADARVQLVTADYQTILDVKGDALHIEGNQLRFKLPAIKPGPLTLSVYPGNSGAVVACNTLCEFSDGVMVINAQVR